MSKVQLYSNFGAPLFYAIVSVYCATVWLLDIRPDSILGWRLFWHLHPVIREPMYVLYELVPVSILQFFLAASVLALAGVLGFNPRRWWFQFFYTHITLVILAYSIFSDPLSRSAVRIEADAIGQGAFYETFGFLQDILAFIAGQDGLAMFLFLFVLAACFFWHQQALMKLFKQDEQISDGVRGR